jgi:heme oxygenase
MPATERLALSPDNALNELRLTTRAEHARIEALLRLDGPMPLERYAAIMSGFDAFLRAWEPRVQAALPARLSHWFRARRRGGFASADLEWLRDVAGIEPAPVDASAAARLPLDDLAALLGSVYVIEDSALGGQVVAPRLKASLGLGPGRGASFFHGFGGDALTMWRDFRVMAALEIGESSKATVRACRSAKRTFGVLIELFEPLAEPPLPDLSAETDATVVLPPERQPPAIAALRTQAPPADAGQGRERGLP